jgi:hypothetical protein
MLHIDAGRDRRGRGTPRADAREVVASARGEVGR